MKEINGINYISGAQWEKGLEIRRLHWTSAAAWTVCLFSSSDSENQSLNMWKGQKPKVLQEAKKSFKTINIPNVDYTHGGTCQCSNNVNASNITDSQKQPNPYQLFCSSKGFIVSRAWSDLLITAPHTSLSPPSSWHLLSKNTLHLRETNFKLSAPFFFPLVSSEKVLFLERLPLTFFFTVGIILITLV